MNIEKLLELLNAHDNVRIEYSFIDGRESLKINGEEVNSTYNDSSIKKMIKEFKANIELLDDNTFTKVLEETKLSLTDVINLLDQESFTEEEAIQAQNYIETLSTSIKEKLADKMDTLYYIYNRF